MEGTVAAVFQRIRVAIDDEIELQGEPELDYY
jgi:hypothetical protein